MPDPRLIEGLSHRRVIAMTGAGISMSPPSLLPSGNELRDVVLKAMASRPGPALASRAMQRIQRRLPYWSPERVFSHLSTAIGGRQLAYCLAALDDRPVNINHRVLAKLVLDGGIRVLLTANFDVLI